MILSFAIHSEEIHIQPAAETVKIGVLAKRGDAKAIKKWGPTAEYLSNTVDSYQFEIVPLDFDEIESAITQQKISFILTNPTMYVDLEHNYTIRRLLTLKNRILNQPQTRFSGVILTHKDNNKIFKIDDLKGRSFAAVKYSSLGGFQMAWGVMHDHQIDPFKDLKSLQYLNTHDAVVKAVLSGEFEAGTVRSDTLERMAAEGLINLDQIRVINQQFADPDNPYPFLRSTPLYPEWPFASLKSTPAELTEAVTISLLLMPEDSAAAIESNSLGWGIPLNYQPVHKLLKKLNIGPYKNFNKITLKKVFFKYWYLILLGVFALIILSAILIYFNKLNKSLRHSKSALDRAHNELEHRVDERTRELSESNIHLEQEIDKNIQTQRALAESEKFTHLILSAITEGVYGIDTAGIITFTNRATEEMLGYEGDELIGTSIQKTVHHSLADDTPLAIKDCPVYQVINSGQSLSGDDQTYWRSDNSHFPIEYNANPIFNRGELIGAVVNFRDISARKQQEASLKRLSAAVEQSPVSVIITDTDGLIEYANPKFCEVTGYELAEVLGLNPNILSSGHQSELFYKNLWKTIKAGKQWSGELKNRRRNGDLFWESVTIAPISDNSGAIINFLAIKEDITEKKQAEEIIFRQANYDSLTELPNRILFRVQLEDILSAAQRQNTQAAVLMVDLDRFKQINDTLGHNFGDLLLKQAAERMLAYLRQSDTLARVGGDEFIVVLAQSKQPDAAEIVSAKMIASLSLPFKLDGHEAFVSASIGIAIYPDDSDKVDKLIQHADTAMYQAKDAGRSNFKFYLPEMNRKVQEHLSIEQALHYAIEHQEFWVEYQPIVDISRRCITGAEALLRWHSNSLGRVTPDRFIPVAEDTGLIVQIGKWVAETVVQQVKEWENRFHVAINLSPRQCRKSDCNKVFTEIIEKAGIPFNLHFAPINIDLLN